MKYYLSNQVEQMKECTVEFTPNPKAEMKLLKMYPALTKQEITGFGGAFTEAAAYAYSKMDESTQERFLELYFGPTGNKYNFCRTHIQSCDFALGNYAYVEDEKDTALESFTIERDKQYIIPLIQKALEKNPDISFLASPWSPPAFMKDTKEMNRGGKLLKEFYQMWADVMAKYVVEYGKLGIKISRLTIQNEPQAVQKWDSCIWTAEEERDFAVGYLKKALLKNNLGDVKIAVWDHNKDCILERTWGSLSDEEAIACIDGVAFHWYSGDHFEALQEIRNQFPDKEIFFTEGCVEYSRFAGQNEVKNAEMYAHDLIGNLNAGANGIIDWNLMLDEKGGPNHVGNFCDAPVMFDTINGTMKVNLSYYYIGHLSRFVAAGAKRVLVTRYTDQIEAVGFVNPDGGKVLVVLNKSEQSQEFMICVDGQTAPIELGAHSIMTACF